MIKGKWLCESSTCATSVATGRRYGSDSAERNDTVTYLLLLLSEARDSINLAGHDGRVLGLGGKVDAGSGNLDTSLSNTSDRAKHRSRQEIRMKYE